MKWIPWVTLVSCLSAVVFWSCRPASEPEAALQKMTHKLSAKFSKVPRISTSDLASWLHDSSRKPPQLIDVRDTNEYAVSHLSGAIQMNPDTTALEVLERVDPARPIVVYCSVGYRSSVLAERLIAAGASEVLNLEGSLFKWANEARPLTRRGRPAHSVHPYNWNFGRMLKKHLHAYH